MSDIAIEVVNLSKKYRIGGQKASYGTIRESIVDAAAAPFRRAGQILRGQPPASNGHDEIWALKDISFEVKRGEVVGIIGPNGAGKSTLLKILSRITRPTEGHAAIHGRVGSLLEVGTGFHPELTGRENIYLSGAVLGMKRAEIERKFDEIVDFSGVEKFVDTPVKYLSSGMYLRLAFAVAAHLDPEILLVDEVLAVGDAEFQKKCLGKMNDVAAEGRTVLFVSHNLGAVSELTHKGMLLERGMISYFGSTEGAIERYNSSQSDVGLGSFVPRGRTGSGNSEIELISLHDLDGKSLLNVSFGKPFVVRITYTTERRNGILGGIVIVSSRGNEIVASHSNDVNEIYLRGSGIVECIVDPNILAPGSYFIRAGLFLDGQTYEMDDRIDRAVDFDVVVDKPGLMSLGTNRVGIVRYAMTWLPQ